MSFPMTRASLQSIPVEIVAPSVDTSLPTQEFIDLRVKGISNMVLSEAKIGNKSLTLNIIKSVILPQLQAGLLANFPDSTVTINTAKSTITVNWA